MCVLFFILSTARWSSDDDGAKPQEQDKDFVPSSRKKLKPLGRRRPISKKHPFGPKKFKPLKRLKPAVDHLNPTVVQLNPTPVGRLKFSRRKVNHAGLFVKGIRCRECPGCLELVDCATCVNCM